MNRALAVVDASETAKEIVRRAGELAAGVDAELVIVHVTTQEEYGDRRRAMESIPNLDASYKRDQALEGARTFANDVAREALDDVDVDYEVVGAIGDRREEILGTAAARDCDHVFVPGRKRSPTGKAVFGDVTQQVVLGFDGAVTVIAT